MYSSTPGMRGINKHLSPFSADSNSLATLDRSTLFGDESNHAEEDANDFRTGSIRSPALDN